MGEKEEVNFESSPIPNTDNLGRDKFWEFSLESEVRTSLNRN